MDGPQSLLELVRDRQLAVGHLRGLFHLMIGRTVHGPGGQLVSPGTTWRELSQWLKAAKYDRELVREIGADPETLSPKDREKFWYYAIAEAKVDSAEARAEADALAKVLKPLGYTVGPAPGAGDKKEDADTKRRKKK